MFTPKRFSEPSRRFKSPRRITITIAHAVYEQLTERSSAQGRSISNLAAYLIEESLARHD